MARSLVYGGLRNKDLCVMYGFTPGQISAILNSPLFKAEVARIEACAEETAVSVSRDLKLMQPRATEVIAEDLFSEDRRGVADKIAAPRLFHE